MLGIGASQMRGISWSLFPSVAFGLVFYASGMMEASPESVFGQRMLVTADAAGCCCR